MFISNDVITFFRSVCYIHTNFMHSLEFPFIILSKLELHMFLKIHEITMKPRFILQLAEFKREPNCDLKIYHTLH